MQENTLMSKKKDVKTVFETTTKANASEKYNAN